MSGISESTLRTWSRLGQRGTFFAVAMTELGGRMDNLRLLSADVSQLSGMTRFASLYPEKFLNAGIAEQNMIGMAAGLALEGRCVFASTYASFIAVRSLEHVRQHLSHLRCNVKVVGTAAGVVAARSGVAHWATEDIAFMRALPHMTVFSPADCLDAYKIACYAAQTDAPAYIRLSGGLNCPIVHQRDYDFVPGENVELRRGRDVCIAATGMMVAEALAAAAMLEETGIGCTVLNVHTVKPLDTASLQSAAREHRLIVTAEEHNIIGGLGSAAAECLAELCGAPRLVRLGVPDTYGAAGSQRWIWERFGLTGEGIAARVRRELPARGGAGV